MKNTKIIFRVLENLLGTGVFFFAFFFLDKEFTIDTIIDNQKNPMLYICILFSFIASYITGKLIGKFIKNP